jgi:hydrogenase expression/formation protein HypE
MSERRSITLNCPLPKLDFDRIVIGHGSGGLLTNRLLEQVIFKALKQTSNHHDGAILQLENKLAYSTDSYVVTPLFFPGGNIGDLAVNGTINDLAMCGAKAKVISLAFIIEEGFLIEDLWEILVSVQHACDNAGVSIVTGDTKVVEKGKGDGIFINTTGIGIVHPNAEINPNRIKEDDVVIISGSIANHGIAIMSVREGLSFESIIQTDSRPLHEMTMEALDTFGKQIHFMRDPTRGGVATVLNEVINDIEMGIVLDEKLLPVDVQVNAACELLGLDPLYVANEGSCILIVNKGIAPDIINLLQKHPAGKNAAIIGEVKQAYQNELVMQSKIGGKRIVRMLPGEQLPRIC